MEFHTSVVRVSYEFTSSEGTQGSEDEVTCKYKSIDVEGRTLHTCTTSM